MSVIFPLSSFLCPILDRFRRFLCTTSLLKSFSVRCVPAFVVFFLPFVDFRRLMSDILIFRLLSSFSVRWLLAEM